MAAHSRTQALDASASASSAWFASGRFTSVLTSLPLVSIGTGVVWLRNSSSVRKRPAPSKLSNVKPTPSSASWQPAHSGFWCMT